MKFSLQDKLSAVRHYLAGLGSQRQTARKFSVAHVQLRRWIAAYLHHGESGLQPGRRRRYTPEFKLAAVEFARSNPLSLADVAARFDIPSYTTLEHWVKLYQEKGAEALNLDKRGHHMSQHPKTPYADKSPDELTPEEMREEIAFLRAQNDYIKKLRALARERRQGASERAKIITALRQKHGLNLLLRVSVLPRSTYYYCCKNSTVPDKYREVKQRVAAIFHAHKGRYGYRRVTCVLRNEGHGLNHKTVQKLMMAQQLKSLVRSKKYRSYKGDVGKVAPNLLQRDFVAQHPNQKWVTDVTEFRVGEDKLYLSPVLGLYNGEIIAYALARRAEFTLVKTMLDKALGKLKPDEQPVLHSDQGWHYRMAAYQHQLREKGIKQSMSRKGNCLDNAVMENFFGHLKAELYYLQRFDNVEHLAKEIENYIDYYNHSRLREKLKGLSPVEYRTQAMKAA
ncbi:IS3 family transposase [Serratia sarumanii]|uniref:IS3 family transposase n=1 Tax=Serratia sarumanii TaxID=3020826 RepID=UPI003F7D2651